MAVMSVEKLYEKYVKPLPVREQLRLVSLMTEELSRGANGVESGKRSILDYEGVGRHNPVGMDAQEYVSQLRSDWDHHP
jgi:hypothetical protein